MNKLTQLFLESRGITPEIWKKYNDPSHGQLAHVDELASRLLEIREAGEQIVILPDFDMDGIMSGTVGYAGLSALGFDVQLFVPNPKEGYGFGPRQVDRLLRAFPYADAIITCDTGIGCLDGVRYAKEDRELKVLVTDHHMESKSCSPRDIADVVVDPCGLDDPYEHPAICGAFVFWQCLNRFAELYGDDTDLERLWFLRFFAGVGTVSDVMPVLYENRQLIKDAVSIAREVWTTSPRFLSAIKEAPEAYTQVFRGVYSAMSLFAGLGKIKSPEDVDEEFFGFCLAPTFNSVKRMDGNLKKAFDVFLGKTPSEDIRYLIDLNVERKKSVNEAIEKIHGEFNPLAPYCYISDALPGVLGLLAMRLSQENGLPCVVVRKNDKTGSYTGSGRSPEWFPFLTATSEMDAHIAGHEGAFGCNFTDFAQLEELYALLDEDIEQMIANGEVDTTEVAADFSIAGDASSAGDAQMDPALLLEFADELEQYRPFGRGFEAPILVLNLNADDAVVTTIGKDKSHLKIRIPVGENGYGRTEYFDVLCWGQAHLIEEGEANGHISIAGKVSVNEFNGHRSAQFVGDVVRGIPDIGGM